MPSTINTKLPTDNQSSSTLPSWIDLAKDVSVNTLTRLNTKELLSAEEVCTTLRKVCDDPRYWRVIEIQCDEGCTWKEPVNDEILCRRAVDLSHGQATHIKIVNFGSNELIRYISQRSVQLRCLSISRKYGGKVISGRCLRVEIPKFPQLEDLHMFGVCDFDASDIKFIAHGCPKLKSFSLRILYPSTKSCDFLAVAVAIMMSRLRQLRIIGSAMTNDVLETILDCSRDLELLDLRWCKDIDMKGDLGERCYQQIKEVMYNGDEIRPIANADFCYNGYVDFLHSARLNM